MGMIGRTRSWIVRLLKHSIGLFLSLLPKSNVVIVLWPLLTEGDRKNYSRLQVGFDYYCKNAKLTLNSYWYAKDGTVTLRVHTPNGQDMLTHRVSVPTYIDLLRTSVIVVLWREEGNSNFLRMFPTVYPLFIERRHYTDWLRILDACAVGNQIPKPGKAFALERHCVKKCKPVAVVCSGPSSSLFFDDATASSFDELIMVNRVVYSPEYYANVKKAWLCAYDPELFSLADATLPSFIDILSEFLMRENHFFVTMTYMESFLRLNLPAHVYEKTLFLKPSNRRHWNIDICKEQSVRNVTNVTLTLALPLAATLAREIVIFGMDGRPPTAIDEDLPHNPAFPYGYKSDYGWSDASCRKVLREQRPSFYSNTRQLVKVLMKANCHLYLAAPSYNPGLAAVPIWKANAEVE